MGFKSGLWLGHSRTFIFLFWSHSSVALPVCLGGSCAFFSGAASVWPFSHKASICEVLQRLVSFQQVLPSQPRSSLVLSERSLGSSTLSHHHQDQNKLHKSLRSQYNNKRGSKASWWQHHAMGMLFSSSDWETCKDRGNNEWSQIQANPWG